MLSEDELKKVNIAVATPCYGGLVCQNYVLSIIRLIATAHKYDFNLSFIIRGGDSLIPRTRNSIVAEFMANPKFTHLLWIDADIGFEPEAVLRLIFADRDVVTGVYPLKKIVWPEGGIPAGMTRAEFEKLYTAYPYNPGAVESTIDQHGFMEVKDAPTGLMLVKRSVFDRLIAAYPGLSFIPDTMLGLEHTDSHAPYHYRFFDVMTEENGRYLSEDYAFCRRWQLIGGKVYADCKSNLTHQGIHMFTGNFWESLMVNATPHSAEPAQTPPEATGSRLSDLVSGTDPQT